MSAVHFSFVSSSDYRYRAGDIARRPWTQRRDTQVSSVPLASLPRGGVGGEEKRSQPLGGASDNSNFCVT